jgi:hypothetical protein
MTIDEMIAAFKNFEEETPFEAAKWALENWDLAAPPLLALLEKYVDRSDDADEIISLVYVALLVMGEKREAGAFPPLCRLMHDDENLSELFAGTEQMFLGPILISTFNGDLAALKSVVADPEASPDGRACALDAMGYLAADDTISKSALHDYLAEQFGLLQPRAENMVWAGMVLAVARLGFADLAERSRRVIADGWVPKLECSLEEFDAMLEQESSAPTGTICFEEEGIGPFVDAIDALEMLDEAGEAGDIDGDDDAPPEDAAPAYQEPVKNPLRNVGRNDPCPCGSGKKYKKCCLV